MKTLFRFARYAIAAVCLAASPMAGAQLVDLTRDVTGVLPPPNGGFGVANNGASTWTISGAYPFTATLTASTGVTFPTSGTLLNDAANSVALGNLAQIAANTILGNATGGAANIAALAIGSCSTAGSAVIWTTNSGFGCNTSIAAATSTKATNLIGGNSTTLLGSIPYQSGTDATTMLGPNTTTTKKFLRQTGSGTNGAAPAWDTVAGADVSGAVATATALAADPADCAANTFANSINASGTLGCASVNSAALNSDVFSTAHSWGGPQTLTSPVITNVSPGANFTLTQNSVVPLTSESTGAVANTLYLSQGNIAIGTPGPAGLVRQVQVSGPNQTTGNITDAGSNGSQIMLFDTGAAPGNGGSILFGASNATSSNNPMAAIKGYLTNGSGPVGDLIISTRNGTADTALTERVRVLSGGNVGIGTAGPGAKLDLNGGGTNHLLLGVLSDATTYNAVSLNGDITNAGMLGMAAGGGIDKALYLKVPTGGSLGFLVNNASKVVVDTNGNVGIGTTSPSAKLSINGGLHVGGDSDPGDNNALIDGTLGVTGHTTFEGVTSTGASGTGKILYDTGSTPTSMTLTNATGLPVGSGISGLGTGVATLLGATPSGTGGIAGTTSPTFVTGTTTPQRGISSGGATTGTVASSQKIVKSLTGILTNTPTTIATVTVPAATNGAIITIQAYGALGAGDLVGARQSAASAVYTMSVVRNDPANARNTVVTLSPVYGNSISTVTSGIAISAFTVTASAISGATSATQTFNLQITINRATGSSTNHTALAVIEVLNELNSGITVN